jgi:16S rRNA (cytidine1402-2'-O)-methyltransferase
MPGTLYVVATPIGNLEDVTFRALRILREVSVIAAEDTRRTARLLQHYSISTRTTSLHEHNERARTPGLIARLRAGESVALVSDAGTPVVSDPGRHFVAAAHEAGIRVEPIPGASAVVAAVSASGLGSGEFAFVGFPPSRSSARKKWLDGLKSDTKVLVMYEAPHRIHQTLSEMLEIFGDRDVAIGRELTKAHEELVVRPISAHLASGSKAIGEYTLVVSPLDPRSGVAIEVPADAELAVEFGDMTNMLNLERREALRELGKKYGLSTRQVYDTLERVKKSVG